MILGTADVHESGTGARTGRRQAHRHLGVRMRAVRDAHRQPAFPGETVSDTIAAILEREPAFEALPAGTHPSIRRLLARCLTKDCGRRLRDIGEARIVIEDTLSGAAPAEKAVTGERSVTRRTAVSALLGAAAGVAGMRLWWPDAPRPPFETRFEITTPATPNFTSMQISPDGRMLAFAAGEGEASRLSLLRLNTTTAKPLMATEGARFPFWSPDGRSIGFFAEGKLKRVDVESGSIRTLADAGDPRGGAWNRDDTILFTPYPGSRIRQVTASGEPLSIANGDDIIDRRFPQFLPDGRHYLYYGTGIDAGIFIGQLGTVDTHRLLEADAAVYAPGGFLLFMHQGTLYGQPFNLAALQLADKPLVIAQQIATASIRGVAAMSASPAGPIAYRTGGRQLERELIWFDRSGKVLKRIPDSNWQEGITFDLSPDGRRVAFDQAKDGATDIWIFDLESGETGSVYRGLGVRLVAQVVRGRPAHRLPFRRETRRVRSVCQIRSGNRRSAATTRSAPAAEPTRVVARRTLPAVSRRNRDRQSLRAGARRKSTTDQGDRFRIHGWWRPVLT